MTSVVSSQPVALSFGRFITLEQAAGLLGVCKRTICREIARERFPKPVKIGNAVRVTIQDVETYVATLRAGSK